MSSNQTRLARRHQQGERLSAKKLNELVDVSNRIIRDGGYYPQQVIPTAGSKKKSITKQYKIASIEGDYLVCNPFNGVETGLESIKVAKPPLLRTSLASRDELTFSYSDNQTRVADDGSNTETQVVVPSYVVGDVIYAKNNIVGGTGVSVVVNGAVTPIEWIIDGDSRAWAKQAS